ncbi:putative secreted Zn-dependent protease [Rhizobium sp. PP-CC-3A-592]|nr:putative secreted Zn-dependent protease [Rhizobium sp. PP-CC-3A-592]
MTVTLTKTIWGFTAAAINLTLAMPLSATAEVKATETVETYTISGKTGAELYASIGERGPLLGANRVIAHTRFKLTWRRDYQRQGNDCLLATAIPRLTITTTLPKPTAKLSAPVRASWTTFIDGVRRHEAVHGQYVRDLVAKIETATIGLKQPDDPGCTKIKTEMNRRLGAISNERRNLDRAFDQAEFTEGGAVHTLILALVNGP